MPRETRRRYIALKIENVDRLDGQTLRRIIQGALLSLFGEYGASKAQFTLIEYDKEKNQAIIRCGHKAVQMLRAAIATITEIKGKPVAPQIIAVSGTLKTLKRKIEKPI